MKLRILESVAGADYSVRPKEIRDDLPDHIAYDLLQSGRAELVVEDENALIAPVEVAISRGRGGRRRDGAKP